MGINELKPDDLEKVNGGTEPPKFWTPEAKAMATVSSTATTKTHQ